ncbi:MAG: NUDIX domain-containing protein [Bacteroidetes bacterium]|nr:MAG: NUDIX domain-containing protein [Bacteroidota bacterium]
MQKIFFNQNTLILNNYPPDKTGEIIKFEELQEIGLNTFLQNPIFKHTGKSYWVSGKDSKELLSYFMNNLTYVPAAGGLVLNSYDEILFIFRHNKWDLPKGKPEGRESMELTAIREVEEECGISGLKIVANLPSTWHIYSLKNDDYAIKRSFWYHMHVDGRKTLKVQTEEDITDAQWVKMPVPEKILDNAFLSIKELVNYFQSQR